MMGRACPDCVRDFDDNYIVGPTDRVYLDIEDCKAIHEFIAQLTGGNPESVFDQDNKSDTINNPATFALCRIYMCAGKRFPDYLKRQWEKAWQAD